jgi:hypothetical protein
VARHEVSLPLVRHLAALRLLAVEGLLRTLVPLSLAAAKVVGH